MKISIVGPPKAGKTTFVRYLETRRPVEKSPHSTLGIDIRSNYIDVADKSIKVIDTGGEDVYQQTFWEMAILMSDAVIFVVDATLVSGEYLELAMSQFNYALDIMPENMPLLIAVNKQDLINHNPIITDQVKEKFEEMNLDGINYRFRGTSAKFGTGIVEVIEWLGNNV